MAKPKGTLAFITLGNTGNLSLCFNYLWIRKTPQVRITVRSSRCS